MVSLETESLGLNVFLSGKLGQKSLDQGFLWERSQVTGLGGHRLAHGLGVADSDLSHHRLRHGDRGRDLEVGIPHRLGGSNNLSGHGLGLDESVVVGRLGILGNRSLDLKSWGLVAAHETLSLGVGLLLGLGGNEETLKGVSGASLLGGSLRVLSHEFLDDLLALFAGGNSSVGVVEEGGELVLLLEVSVVGLESNVESDDGCKGSNESDEGASAREVLLELHTRGALGSEHAEDAGALLGGLAGTLVLVRFFCEDSHGDVVVATHSAGRGLRSLELFAILSCVDKHVMGTSLVVGRAGVVERGRVLLG